MEDWSHEILKKCLYPLVSVAKIFEKRITPLKKKEEISMYKMLFLSHNSPNPVLIPEPPALPILSLSLRRSLYWLNESAPKAGSQALWSNPIWFYPIASAGHRGINNKQLYHKCLITQHNLLMAPSCSSSHPVHGKQCNRLAIPPNLRNFHALWN